jgi:hypothetical protein
VKLCDRELREKVWGNYIRSVQDDQLNEISTINVDADLFLGPMTRENEIKILDAVSAHLPKVFNPSIEIGTSAWVISPKGSFFQTAILGNGRCRMFLAGANWSNNGAFGAKDSQR